MPVSLSIEDVSFIDPFGVVGILVLLEAISEHSGQRPILVVPRDRTVCSYLSKLNAWAHLRGLSECRGDLADSSPHSSPSDVLLELSPIKSQSDIDDVLETLQKLLGSNLGYSAKSLNAVLQMLSELCHNVIDHSEGGGWAAAQRYFRADDGTRFVRVAVADSGIGVRASLGKRYNVAAWTHRDAIVNALKKEYSQFPARGLGLPFIGRLVKEFKGGLDIRSGDCRIYISKQPRGLQGAHFPGTQVGVSLTELEGA